MVSWKVLGVDEEFQLIGNNAYKGIPEKVNELVYRLISKAEKLSGQEVEEYS